ncbi:hypothetical protein ACH5RR_025460 [Cinchona calisaya]|uniref:RNase H type-1 domain-containing protein n=1 Tax=Cinchona calisaya TaxID=153742 RepID=A0ABD2YZQ0_9GENT
MTDFTEQVKRIPYDEGTETMAMLIGVKFATDSGIEEMELEGDCLQLVPTVVNDSLENWKQVDAAYNIGSSVEEHSGLSYAYDGDLKIGCFQASIFCGGHTYFIQAMSQQLRLESYAVHATFNFLVNAMLMDLPNDAYGPLIRFREYSLFDNLFMPRR